MTLGIDHQPVLFEEVLKALEPKPNHWYLDGTLGAAGHTIGLLKKGVKVIAFDQDQEAIDRAKKNIEAACPGIKLTLDAKPPNDEQCILVNQNFNTLSQVLTDLGNIKLSGALLDLGTSTYQLLDTNRGFSFQYDAPLDMRMDTRLGVTAADLVNALPEKHLVRLFQEYSDEPYAVKIAKVVAQKRTDQPFRTTKQLSDLISRIKPKGSIHPATQVFQALRIAVNLERDTLMEVLPQIADALLPNSILAIISFHSGEDRIVKHFLNESNEFEVLTKTPITPSQTEITNNPRSRSAKMRLAQKK